MSTLPGGTVTFLFTDIEGSTQLWEKHPEAMKAALARHDAIIRGAIKSNRGQITKTTGHGFHSAFDKVIDAVNAVTQIQTNLEDKERLSMDETILLALI